MQSLIRLSIFPTLLTYGIDTLQGYAAWHAGRYVVIQLDHFFHFDPNPASRGLSQALRILN